MKNIKTFIILIFVIECNTLFSQDYCIPNRFVDNYYFKSRDINVDKNIIYSKTINYKGKTVELALDIFYPKKSVDSLEYRPLIMLFHGGGIKDEDKEQTEKYCPLFAQRGFVVANINYRLGYSGIYGDSTHVLAFYRAVQDAYSALNYLLNNSRKYSIDPNSVFIGGRSAGGVISLALAYMEQKDYDEAYPYLRGLLGDVDNTTYLPKVEFTAKGVINMWGADIVESYISPLEAQKIPVIMFYGTEDDSFDKGVELIETIKRHDGCYQIYSRIGAGHGEDMSKYYIAAKTGCFIKSIFCGECTSLRKDIDNKDLLCDFVLPIDKIPIERTTIKIDNSLLNQFTGVYRNNQNRKEQLIILLENGYLTVQDREGSFKNKLYLESNYEFFIKEDNIQCVFNKDKNGNVSGLTIYIDAKQINYKKIK